MSKFYLTKVADNENVLEEFELNETEYNEFTRTVRKQRAENVQKLIKELAETIGAAETRHMIRQTLRELE